MNEGSDERLDRVAATLRMLASELDACGGMTPDAAKNVSSLSAYRPRASDHSLVRKILRARRKIDDFFQADMFADPARDILMDLFAAEAEQRFISVSSACIAASVPLTTALRWLERLHQCGLIQYSADRSDKRRRFVTLSEEGRSAMRGYINALRVIFADDS